MSRHCILASSSDPCDRRERQTAGTWDKASQHGGICRQHLCYSAAGSDFLSDSTACPSDVTEDDSETMEMQQSINSCLKDDIVTVRLADFLEVPVGPTTIKGSGQIFELDAHLLEDTHIDICCNFLFSKHRFNDISFSISCTAMRVSLTCACYCIATLVAYGVCRFAYAACCRAKAEGSLG